LRETALIRAVRSGSAPVVKLLVERNANIDETDSSGATALSLAQSLRKTQIVDILKKAGAK
jgi:ankyrin repeat protein